ncbi:hypothetical protein B0O80DRAFT_431731 [Mortierella sp. GBAus27b]|nr:hypothetical protein B0O80DRAFT_431731 [Mortierella sp. GBAus27b]
MPPSPLLSDSPQLRSSPSAVLSLSPSVHGSFAESIPKLKHCPVRSALDTRLNSVTSCTCHSIIESAEKLHQFSGRRGYCPHPEDDPAISSTRCPLVSPKEEKDIAD